VTVALVIATAKASLVAMFFMHLKGERPMVMWPLALTAFLFVALFAFLLLAEGDHLFGTKFGDAFQNIRDE
jgi:caa(3)-type oxidase subunit IV